MMGPGENPTSAPERLLAQEGGSETLRSDLLRARDQMRDPHYDVDAGLEAFRQAAGMGTTASSPPAKWGPLKLALVVGGVLILGGAISGGVDFVSSSMKKKDPPARTITPSLPEESASRAQTLGSAESDSRKAEQTAAPIRPANPPLALRDSDERARDVDDAASVHLPPPAALPPPPARRTPELPPSSPTPPLQDEVAQLKRIRSTLASRPAEALRLAEEGHRSFQGGFLFEEREGLAIIALEKLGRVAEARSRAHRYRQRFPKSALLPRMDALFEAP